MNTRTKLATWVDSYLADRRHAGFVLKVEGAQLMRFVQFAEQIGHRGALTVKLAIQWASNSRSGKSLTAARRIEVIRPFASYCLQFDAATQIPPRSLFGQAHRRLTPHIFTQSVILDLLEVCDQLFPAGGLRGATCAAVFGLIASTGLRISEATALTRADVDLGQRLLHIHGAKFANHAMYRCIPKRRRPCAVTSNGAISTRLPPIPMPSSCSITVDVLQLEVSSMPSSCYALRSGGMLARGEHPEPRVHDLRHSFVCHRLQEWYAQGLIPRESGSYQ